MSFEVTTAFVQQYSANMMSTAQQKGSRLRRSVTVENGVGEDYYFDYTGVVEAKPINDRHGDSPLNSTPHSRRRVDLAGFDTGDLIDSLDKVQMLADPTSGYVQAHGSAMGRKMDDVIIAAAFGASKTGKDGSTNVTFPAGNIVAVDNWDFGTGSGNAGLTISKLIKARTILVEAEAIEEEAGEPIYFCCAQKQIANLLSTTEATSADYAEVKALVKGTINSFMGFDFIRSERLKKTGNNRLCMAYTQKGLGLAIGKDITARLAERSDKRFSMYAYFQMFIGATRLRETDVVQVLCLEA